MRKAFAVRVMLVAVGGALAFTGPASASGRPCRPPRSAAAEPVAASL
jgi:hypothetical protein